jgi:hypothetical protein
MGGYLALALIAVAIMASVGNSWLVDRKVTANGYHINALPDFNVNQALWVGADALALTDASIIVKGFYYLGINHHDWVDCTATPGTVCCAGSVTDNTNMTTSWLETHYWGNASGIGYGYAWQNEGAAPLYCPSYQDN